MSQTRITGSGVKAKELRTIPDFTGLELAGVGTVRLSLGLSIILAVEADDNVLPYLETEVIDGTLSLRQAKGVRLDKTLPIVYTVVAPTVSLLALSGAGDIYADDLSTETLELVLSGAGDMKLRGLAVETLNVRVSGAGTLELTGSAKKQDIVLSGAGRLRACALAGEDVTIRLSGTGDAHVWATASLGANVSGVGAVRYRGEPLLTKRVTGIGVVKASQDCP